jgi:hypothetical protein
VLVKSLITSCREEDNEVMEVVGEENEDDKVVNQGK